MNRDTPEPTHPYPPRFRWLKRGVVLLVLWIGFIAGLRAWWGYEANRRYQSLIASAHAAGQPILPEDFDSPAVPAAQNAAMSLTNAANALTSNRGYDTLADNYSGGPLTKADLQVLKTTLAANTIALQLARRARSQAEVDWGYQVRTPVMSTFPPPGVLSAQRQLAMFLRYAALYEHAIGNDREATELTRDILRQSNAVAQGPSVLVTNLVARGIAGTAIATAEQISPDLRVTTNRTDANAAPARLVEDLIGELLDERAFRQAAQYAWYGERMWELDAIENMGIGAVLPGQKLFMLEPMFRLDGVRAAVRFEPCVKAESQADWPAADAALPNHPRVSGSHLEEMTRILSAALTPAVRRAINVQFNTSTERRAAAIELAIRLYRADHDGQYPPRLEDLSPKYLASVPSDPMAAGNRPFGYHLNFQPPVIYSVGDNGIDDGGTSLPSNALNDDRWQKADAVFPLAPFNPGTNPNLTTQPATGSS